MKYWKNVESGIVIACEEPPFRWEEVDDGDYGMPIEEILSEIEKAYAIDIFPDTTVDERREVANKYPGFIDRTSASMGRHLVTVIRRKLAGNLTQHTPDDGDSAGFLNLFYPIFDLLNKVRRSR